jgi:SAM-dependent methyltransferase
VCALVFVDPQEHPSTDAECARYLQHQNRPDDAGYLSFLDPVVQAVRRTIKPGARGLDFGSGPAPVLAGLLTATGYRMRCHDPFFADQPAALADRYDFVVANEVIEHFREPAKEFETLEKLLCADARLFLRTGRPPRDETAFLDWHYLSDPTHLAFYHPETIAWIAARHGWTVLEEPIPGLWVLENAR